MVRSLASRFKQFSTRLGFERDWYLILVAAVIGLVMSGVAMAFILPLRWIEERADATDPSLLWWLVPTLPIAGALLAGIVHALIPTPDAGPGVTKVMYAIYRRKSRIPPVMALRKWLASTLTIGSGGSAGAEGPIVTIGAVIGSVTGQLLRTNGPNTATLLGCGAAAGIASVFNAPIAGVFFVMEILLRDFSLRTFTPIVIASVISAAVTQGVLGADALFAAGDDFSVEAFTWREIPNYLILGVACGIFAVMFVRALYATSRRFERLPGPDVLKPALGALLLGGLGLGFLWLQQGSARMPLFYGNGYPAIRTLLEPAHYYVDAAHTTLGPAGPMLIGLVALGTLKGLATCLTVGSGGAGGMFAPSLLMGAAVGGAFGYVVSALGWFPAASPAHYALVGMASMVAATTHAPLTAILIVYEITRSYEVILPLMLAAVISTIVARLFLRSSVYTVRLEDLGVRVGAMSDLTVLRRLVVQDVPLVAPVFVHPEDSAQRLLELSERMSVTDFVVTDRRHRYVALVTGGDLKEALVHREAIPLLQVNELQRSDLPTVTGEDTLDVVLDRFSRHDVNSLVVLDERGDGAVLGLITRSRLMQRYQDELSKD
ncbi:MAG: chloride channel protein [Phycisphaerales bacterium]|nr:chloride channel protein [Phycisphaerae bacterium]NNF44057.1 chloride channel protein [Phycisphaerales bacterium]NNM26154.1 chloride channel protein [Phycisphaerales bacterium]